MLYYGIMFYVCGTAVQKTGTIQNYRELTGTVFCTGTQLYTYRLGGLVVRRAPRDGQTRGSNPGYTDRFMPLVRNGPATLSHACSDRVSVRPGLVDAMSAYCDWVRLLELLIYRFCTSQCGST